MEEHAALGSPDLLALGSPFLGRRGSRGDVSLARLGRDGWWCLSLSFCLSCRSVCRPSVCPVCFVYSRPRVRPGRLSEWAAVLLWEITRRREGFGAACGAARGMLPFSRPPTPLCALRWWGPGGRCALPGWPLPAARLRGAHRPRGGAEASGGLRRQRSRRREFSLATSCNGSQLREVGIGRQVKPLAAPGNLP